MPRVAIFPPPDEDYSQCGFNPQAGLLPGGLGPRNGAHLRRIPRDESRALLELTTEGAALQNALKDNIADVYHNLDGIRCLQCRPDLRERCHSGTRNSVALRKMDKGNPYDLLVIRVLRGTAGLASIEAVPAHVQGAGTL
jgi:hypothetical protein